MCLIKNENWEGKSEKKKQKWMWGKRSNVVIYLGLFNCIIQGWIH